MTDIKVGDRVRAPGKTTDDTAEFTVLQWDDYGLHSEENIFRSGLWDFQVIRPALPTEPGIYAAPHSTDATRYKILALDIHGKWHWLDLSVDARFSGVDVETVQRFAATMVKAFE